MATKNNVSISSVKFEGEMLPWVQNYWGENILIRITDPSQKEILDMAVPKRPGDNFMPYIYGIAHVRPPQGELHDYWEKKAKNLNGKQVCLVAIARRFDGECVEYGPEHGWALEIISIKIIKKKWTALDRKHTKQAKRGPQRGK